MNKLNMYMRAVVVTALMVVGGLGVFKGRAMLHGGSKEPKIVEKKEANSAEDKSAPGAIAAKNNDLKTSPEATASITKRDALAGPATEMKPKKSLLGSFKFSGADKTSAAASTSLNDDPPPAPKVPAAVHVAADDYVAPPPASSYGNAAPPTAPPPPAFAGYGANSYGAPGNDTSPTAPPVMVAENAVPPANNAVPPGPSYGTPAAALAPPAVAVSEPESATPINNNLPANKLSSVAPLNLASPPANTLNDYAPTRAPEAVPNRLASNPLASNPLSAPLPARSVTPSARYAEDVNVKPAANSVPVDPQFQGQQTPSIVLEKFAPPEVQVGKPAMFEIQVKNVGKVSAFDVQVVDEIPRGTRFQQANPQPSQTAGGKLLWKLGVMKPGDEQIIELQLVPESEGEIGSVAQVSFQAQVGSKSVVTKPKLELRHQAPPQIHAGDMATVSLTIANTGSGAASGVYLESDVPEGFSHPAGKELEFQIGTLRPGDSKTIDLAMKAEKAGNYQCVLVVHGDPDLTVQDVAKMEVVAPSLQLQVQGPKKRFVERQATHTITIGNPGTATAKGIDMVAYLPRGFKFISADQQGQYDARQHLVLWNLEELPPGSSGNVQLTTLPIEAGDQKVRVEAHSATGLSADTELNVAVDSVSELPFTVADLADPIEVNSETVYEIRIANHGARAATNVRIAATFPPEIRPLEGDGVSRATISGQKVDFAPIGTIQPGAEAIVKIQAQGLRPGDHRVAVTLTSDEHPQPVTREEGTRVYLDQ